MFRASGQIKALSRTEWLVPGAMGRNDVADLALRDSYFADRIPGSFCRRNYIGGALSGRRVEVPGALDRRVDMPALRPP